MKCFLASPLIGMYAKCGNTADVQQVFDSLTTRNTTTWNALNRNIYPPRREPSCLRHISPTNKTLGLRPEGTLPNGVAFVDVLVVLSYRV